MQIPQMHRQHLKIIRNLNQSNSLTYLVTKKGPRHECWHDHLRCVCIRLSSNLMMSLLNRQKHYLFVLRNHHLLHFSLQKSMTKTNSLMN